MNVPIPILTYHGVSEEAAPQFRQWVVHPKAFAAHMAYLRDQQYTPMTVTQLARLMIDHSAGLPQRPVVITFDDGFADFFTEALPVLKQYEFEATLYIVSQYVGQTSRWLCHEGEGNRPMLTWSQIAEISAAGVECGAHSHSHPQLDLISTASARDEIVRSKRELEQHLNRPVETFAYPHGYHSSMVRRLVQEAGYSSACAVKHAMSALTDDRFALARIFVLADTTDEDFARLLVGHRLRVAPAGKRLDTIGWRILRRWGAVLRQTRYA